MQLRLKKYPRKINSVKNFPQTPGVYVFWEKETPIYIGKAINIKKRVLSYFSHNLIGKTLLMVNTAEQISFIRVDNELEALLLEAKLVNKYKPKFNVELKDDKNPLYIKISNEKYPRVLVARKIDKSEKDLSFLGPFPSSTKVKEVLYLLRRIFPYSTHKIGKRACLYNQINLCKPCPNYIESLKDEKLKKQLLKEYKYNINSIKGILAGRIKYVRKSLEKRMRNYAKDEYFENANNFKKKIEALDYITKPATDIKEYLKNPNLYEDIRKKEITDLTNLLTKFFPVNNLTRIECIDVSHLFGTASASSMVTFIDGESDKSLYRRFKIRTVKYVDDVSSLDEVIKRRIKHFKDWGKPDLIVVDGGKPQVGVFYKNLSIYKIPTIGLAKRYETIVIPYQNQEKINFIEYILPKGHARNLLQRIRNEAHRFAISYHKKLFKKSLFS